MEELSLEPEILSVDAQPQRDTSLLLVTVISEAPKAAQEIANQLPHVVNRQQRERQAQRYGITKTNLVEKLTATEEEVLGIRGQLAQLDPEAAEDKVEYSTLSAKLTSLERRLETLRQNIFNIRLTEDQESNLLAVIQVAFFPEVPISPNVLRDTLLAAILGAMVGLGAGFFIEYLDDTIKPNHDIENIFGISVLAFIGRVEQEEKNRLLVTSPEHPRAVTEAYRMLRTNIRFAMVDNRSRAIVVASPRPGEGKSTTAANLAIVMAQAGHKTLLVDADLRRPVQHKIFGVGEKTSQLKGLTTALLNPEQPIERYLEPTSTENLMLLSSGPVPPNPSELLGSSRLQDLIRNLQKLADYVIIDTPPILTVTDSTLLASFVGGVLLVVRANSTELHSIEGALGQLKSVNAKVLGCILNDIKARRGGYYYYYNYYDNNYYYNEDEQPPTPSLGGKISSWLSSIRPKS
jgi:non-specific protein-tyrosine kinase